MFVQRTLACLACAAASSLPAGADAQGVGSGPHASGSSSIIGAWPARGYLGLSIGRSRRELSCGTPGLGCDTHPAAAHLFGGYILDKHLVVTGHVGAAYARANTSAMGAAPLSGADAADGLSYGAGISWTFSPRASATLGWDSQELRLPGAGRDTLRSARLGLQWRY